MRLIDADKIGNATASDIEVYSFNLVPYIKVEDLLSFIDNQPTAYDIDKVVEELKESKKSIVGKYDSSVPILENASHKIAFNNGIDKAIKIVKAGVENDR